MRPAYQEEFLMGASDDLALATAYLERLQKPAAITSRSMAEAGPHLHRSLQAIRGARQEGRRLA